MYRFASRRWSLCMVWISAGYIDMGCILFRCRVFLYEVRHYHLAEVHTPGMLFPVSGKRSTVRPISTRSFSSLICFLPPAASHT